MTDSIRRRLTLARAPAGALSFALVNEGTNSGVPAALPAIAVACETQLNAEFAAEWGGRYIVRVAPNRANVTDDEVPVILQDTLPVPNAAGYHTTLTPSGKPVAYIGLAGVRSLTIGPDALSVTISHELLETAADPTANRWEQLPDGRLLALEVCDEIEDTAYMAQNGVYVSNFLFQSYFAPGSMGPYDKLGILTAQLQETSGGYAIVVAGMGFGVATANEVHGELKALPIDVGVATMAATIRVGDAAPVMARNLVVAATHRPRESRMERKQHASSRAYRRGLRFGYHTPPPAPALVPRR